MNTNFTLPLVQDSKLDLSSGAKIKTFRREQTKFFVEFADWWKKANVGVVTAMSQSEANGWITLTMCYYECSEMEKSVFSNEKVLSRTVDVLADVAVLLDGLFDDLVRKKQKPKPISEPKIPESDSSPEVPGDA